VLLEVDLVDAVPRAVGELADLVPSVPERKQMDIVRGYLPQP
jgi:hypothetical protein